MYYMFVFHIYLFILSAIYLGICIYWDLGITEFHVSISVLCANLGFIMLQIQNVWYSDLIPRLLNAAQELNLKSGKQ